MKRKILRVTLALLIGLSLCLSMTLPVAAAGPNDNKPVAWVNHTSNTNNDPAGHQALVFSVKLLADGTTVGKVVTHSWIEGPSKPGHFTVFDQTATNFFESDGAKIAEFVVYIHLEPDVRAKYMLVDNGEPGKDDLIQIWVWLPDIGEPYQMWWPLLGPQDMSNPAFGLPVPIINGNVQVHITEDN